MNYKDYRDELIINVQWKADCWRNVCVDLIDAIQSKDKKRIDEAILHFEEIKKLFPYTE